MRHVARRDKNERALIRYLRRLGLCVQQLSQEGVPDLLVSLPGTPFSLLLEVKDRYGTLTPTQKVWIGRWNGQVFVVRSVLDIKELLRGIMPIYCYICEECEETLEVKQKFSDPPLTTCPTCGGSLVRQPQLAGIIFRGKGFTKSAPRPKNTPDS